MALSRGIAPSRLAERSARRHRVVDRAGRALELPVPHELIDAIAERVGHANWRSHEPSSTKRVPPTSGRRGTHETSASRTRSPRICSGSASPRARSSRSPAYSWPSRARSGSTPARPARAPAGDDSLSRTSSATGSASASRDGSYHSTVGRPMSASTKALRYDLPAGTGQLSRAGSGRTRGGPRGLAHHIRALHTVGRPVPRRSPRRLARCERGGRRRHRRL